MVYLSDEEFASLRRMSDETGATQTELIRRGLHTVLEQAPEAQLDYVTGTQDPRRSRPMRWTSFGRH